MTREQRLAKNEVLFRDVNERVRDISADAWNVDEQVEFLRRGVDLRFEVIRIGDLRNYRDSSSQRFDTIAERIQCIGLEQKLDGPLRQLIGCSCDIISGLLD